MFSHRRTTNTVTAQIPHELGVLAICPPKFSTMPRLGPSSPSILTNGSPFVRVVALPVSAYLNADAFTGAVLDAISESPKNLLLYVKSYVSLVERDRVARPYIFLSNSIIGRPRTMLPLDTFLRRITFHNSTRKISFVLDFEYESTRRGTQPTQNELADATRLISEQITSNGATGLVRCIHVSRRVCGLDAALYFASAWVFYTGSRWEHPVLLNRLYSDAKTPGDAFVTNGADLGQEPENEMYLEHSGIFNDAFSSSFGSRMDAVLDIADLLVGLDTDSPIRDLLGIIAETDPDQGVRNLALRYSGLIPTQDSLRDLISIGVFSDGDFARSRTSPVPEFVLLDTGGTVLVGVDSPGGQAFERPRHAARCPPFYIARLPITVLQYAAFLDETQHPAPESWFSDSILKDHGELPVTMVSWFDSMAYCRWLTQKLRTEETLTQAPIFADLPSEIEWEAAANSLVGYEYPWGSRFDSSRCNMRDSGIQAIVPSQNYSPAGDSVQGVVGLIGNVWEWTRSIWGRSALVPEFLYPYDASDGREDVNADGKWRRVTRGGAHYYARECSNSYTRNRVFPNDVHPCGGFRPVLRFESVAHQTKQEHNC